MIDYVHLNPIFFWIMNTHTNTHLVSFFLLKCFHFSTCTCVCYYCCQPMRMDGLHASTSITLQMQASVYIRVFHLIHHPHGYIWMCDAKRSVSERHSILLGIPSGVGWGRCLRVHHVRLWRTLDMSEFARDTEFFRWLSAFFLPSALTIWSLSTALLFVCLASVHVERSQLASRSQFPLVKRKRYKYVNNMTTSSASCVWPISKMAEISFTQLMAENVGSLRPAQNSKEMYILLYVRKVHFVHCVYLVFMFLYYFLLLFVFIPAAAVARCIRDHSHTHTHTWNGYSQWRAGPTVYEHCLFCHILYFICVVIATQTIKSNFVGIQGWCAGFVLAPASHRVPIRAQRETDPEKKPDEKVSGSWVDRDSKRLHEHQHHKRWEYVCCVVCIWLRSCFLFIHDSVGTIVSILSGRWLL